MRVIDEIDRRVPLVDETGGTATAGQEEPTRRKAGSAAPAALLVAITLLALAAATLFVAWALAEARSNPAAGHGDEPMDGSGAGANAVTFEEIETEASRDGE